jgi:gamma-glutamyltranspeptidase/glutathione hydrolase
VDGRAPQAGEIWKNPNYADTMRILVDEGRDGFYKGELARRISDYMAENDGFLDYDDLANHQGEWVEPVSTNYRGYDVWQIPPNGQGIAGLQILNVLEGFDLSEIEFGSAEHVHLFVEAKKLAFEDRARHYADPDYMEVDVDWLISKEYAAKRRELIDPDQSARTVEAGRPELNEGDTIYLTTADQYGNMVSFIQSNYRGMGSGMTPPGAGFILQNRGEMFVLKEGHPNTFAPAKRPFHTIIPAFITENGQPWVSFGLMGGGMQPQGHAQIVMNLVDFGMGLQEAGDAPRIHHTGSTEPTGQALQMTDGGEINLESGFDYDTIRGLLDRGHHVSWARGPFGGYQAIMVDYDQRTEPPTRVYRGASESRKDGQAAGF